MDDGLSKLFNNFDRGTITVPAATSVSLPASMSSGTLDSSSGRTTARELVRNRHPVRCDCLDHPRLVFERRLRRAQNGPIKEQRELADTFATDVEVAVASTAA